MKDIKAKIAAHKILAGLAAALLIFAAARLIMNVAGGPAQRPGGGPVYVELGQARHGVMREVGLYYGSLVADRQFSVSPRVGGRLDELCVDLGSPIESGQTLARLDGEPYRLARDREAHNVALAQAQFEEAKANLVLAKNDMERQSALAGKRIVAQSDFEVVENKLKQAQARLEVAASQLQAAQNTLANAELELSYATVTSRWAGGGQRFISQKMAHEGDQVLANNPILAAVSLDPLLLAVDVIEKDYPKISVGQKAELKCEAWPGESFAATVKNIAPVLSAASRQARVELEVANPGYKLKPGMFMEAVFVFNEKKDVWSVPEDVPFRSAEGFVIFVADEATQTVRKVPVTLGLVEKGYVELAGLASIDGPVVVLGQHLLADGQGYRLVGGEAGGAQ